MSRFVSLCRRTIPLLLVLWAVPVIRTEAITIDFTARIGPGNDIDMDDVFGEGFDASLKGQIIAGSVTMDPASLTGQCGTGGASYSDSGGGAISISFTLNGIISTVVSTGTSGMFGDNSVASVSVSDPADGGYNYLAAAVISPNEMLQQSIGVLFNNATLFPANGDGDPAAAIDSLGIIGEGAGLVIGGITLMTPDEHLDATITSIEAVPEPTSLALFGVALIGMRMRRRTVIG